MSHYDPRPLPIVVDGESIHFPPSASSREEMLEAFAADDANPRRQHAALVQLGHRTDRFPTSGGIPCCIQKHMRPDLACPCDRFELERR